MSEFINRTEFRVFRQPWIRDTLQIRMAKWVVSGGRQRVAIPQPVEMKLLEEEEHAFEIPVLFDLRPDEAQQLIDELWRAGIRPTEGAGSVGQLAAVQAHLQDMRSLVFQKAPTK